MHVNCTGLVQALKYFPDCYVTSVTHILVRMLRIPMWFLTKAYARINVVSLESTTGPLKFPGLLPLSPELQIPMFPEKRE